MSNHLEILELNGETAERLCNAYDGYGDATARWVADRPIEYSRPEKGALIGGAYVTAGIYRSLFDQESAASFFKKAVPFYKDTNQPFWKLVAVCSFMREAGRNSNRDTNDGLTQEDYFFDLMFNNFTKTELKKWSAKYLLTDDQLKQWMRRPVGRLGIPLVTYNAMTGDDEKSIIAMFSILARSAEQTRLLQSDRYHWKRMAGILPFEPEVLAASVVFLSHWEMRNSQLNALLDQWQNIDRILPLPVLIAREMIESQPGDNIVRRRI